MSETDRAMGILLVEGNPAGVRLAIETLELPTENGLGASATSAGALPIEVIR